MQNPNLSALLLQWYEKNGRALPWRHKGGAHPNPYIVLVSEIMLQQTTVKTVLTYFDKFIKRFPAIESLAAASLEEVYLYWQGLGYYSRARSLHSSAEIIVRNYGGHFPKNIHDVAKLKGLGSYSIASFLALAFNQPQTVVDGNVMRIISRLYHLTDPLDDILPQIKKQAEILTDKQNAADYASAIMDLGALICTPKNPKCAICPWSDFCLSKNAPDVEKIPLRRKIARKSIKANVYLIHNRKNEIFIRKRQQKGLLSGLYEFPWSEEALFDNAQSLNLSVKHIFTHIDLTLDLYQIFCDKPESDGFFINQNALSEYPSSTLMKKVWNAYIKSIDIE